MLYVFNSFSAGTVFRRQIMTSEVGPRTERVKCLVLAGVQPLMEEQWTMAKIEADLG